MNVLFYHYKSVLEMSKNSKTEFCIDKKGCNSLPLHMRATSATTLGIAVVYRYTHQVYSRPEDGDSFIRN